MSGAPPLERSLLEGKERGELQVIAESLGLKPGLRMRKAELVDRILDATGAAGGPGAAGAPARPANGSVSDDDAPAANGKAADQAPPSPNGVGTASHEPPRVERAWSSRGPGDDAGGRRRRRRGRGDRATDRDYAAAERAASSGEHPDTGEPVPVTGLLDLRDEGFGFIRAGGYVAGPDDV